VSDETQPPSDDPATQNETRAEELSDELARKYSPEKLLRMISRRAGKGESLDHSVRAKYEKKFGVDLGHVRIYTGEFAEEFNRKRDAYAVTIGSTGMILMGGSPDKSMATPSGQALLAHELTHVAQQSKGLHRKGTFDGAMEFTHEDEAAAEEVEHEEMAGQSLTAKQFADVSKASMQAADDRRDAIEKIKERVLQIAADAARSQLSRNGSSRRA
jgi:hypothetical protein